MQIKTILLLVFFIMCSNTFAKKTVKSNKLSTKYGDKNEYCDRQKQLHEEFCQGERPQPRQRTCV
jgi:hypothetical protein